MQMPATEKLTEVIYFEVRLNTEGGLRKKKSSRFFVTTSFLPPAVTKFPRCERCVSFEHPAKIGGGFKTGILNNFS